ncbi:MAG: transglycosylase SLT domain-containing protein [Caldilineaceae bacterium]|nr:transglycosylase SLT domain-containing protein [Caldilineaceae bacterium]
MPHFDQIEIIYPDGQIQFVDLDPAIGILNIGRHPDNDIVFGGPNVRSFHALIDHRQFPYQWMLLDDAGGIGEAQEFSQWQSIRIGDHELVLMSSATQDLAPSTAPAQSAVPWRAPASRPVPQGSAAAAAHTLTIHNSGDRDAVFLVNVDGIDPRWVALSSTQVTLRPGEGTQIQIGLAATLAPGVYPLTWQITSPQYPGWQQAETLSLVASPRKQTVEASDLEPKNVRSERFRRHGKTILTLVNEGNHPVDYLLRARDARGDCRFRFRLLAGEEAGAQLEDTGDGSCRIALAGGQRVAVQITITPTEGGPIGLRAGHYRFVVQGNFPGASQIHHSHNGAFESHPPINIGTLLLVVALIALAALFFYREDLGLWVDSWRYRPALAASVAFPAPTPSALLHGFTAEELARYRSSPERAQALGGPGPIHTREDLQSYEEIFIEIGRQYNVDWRLLAALSYRESRLNPKARGRSGEYGLMQIMPGTWNEWAPLVLVNDPWDPYSNLAVGAAYFSYIHSYFTSLGHSDPRWALAAYNWGPERVLQILDRNGQWQEIPLPTRQYVADILLSREKAPALVRLADQAAVQ